VFDDAENALHHGRSFPVDLHAGFGGHAPPGEFQSRLIEEKGGKKQAEACTLTLLEYRLQPASASFHDFEILLHAPPHFVPQMLVGIADVPHTPRVNMPTGMPISSLPRARGQR
jgi:hypothetical protein